MTTFKTAVLTGRPGIGKTTALIKVLEMLRSNGFTVGGFYTRELRRSGVRYGFEIHDIMSGRTAVMASVDLSAGPKIGRYRVSINNIDKVGVASIRNALDQAQSILVDEVGPMELLSQAFVEAVRELLRSDKPKLLTIHLSARHPLVEEVRRAAGKNLYLLDMENRDIIPSIIFQVMVKWLTS